MSAILARLLAKRGATIEGLGANTKVGKIVRSRGVSDGPELKRIRDLPRRQWDEDEEELAELVALMTKWLKTPHGTQTLRPMQAAVLKELYDYGRVVNVANVGEGKSLLSALAPTVLDSKRPLLFNFAKLVDKARREFMVMAHDWKVCRHYEFFNYEKLGLVQYDTFLDRLCPDFVCADESHAFRRESSGRTKRFKEWRKKCPDVPFLPLTGTPGEASVKDPAHIVGWAMGDTSPFPRSQGEIKLWSEALDVNVDEFRRLHPGALMTLEDSALPSTLENARAVFGRRIEQTPGFVAKRTASVACSLYLQALVFNDYAPATERLCEDVRGKNSTPDGKEFREGVILGTIMKWASCGFFYLIDPDPPAEWREARRQWGAFCRDDLHYNRSRRFTPLQVALACSKGEIDARAYNAWKAIEPTFKPHHVTQWIDLAPIHRMIKWMNDEGGLVWTPYRAVGDKISELTGVPYFANGGLCARTGRNIETYKDGPAVLSVEANKLGRNLQDRWSKELVVGGISSADDLNQVMGRVHRPGQKADACEITFFWGCYESAATLYKARKRAEFDRDVGRNTSNKLLLCDWLVPSESELEDYSGSRWEKE